MRAPALIPALALLACLPLLGGASCGATKLPTMPKTVEVPVRVIVPVPPELTRDCDEVAKQGDTYEEAIRLANARKASLAECTGRMRAIRELKR